MKCKATLCIAAIVGAVALFSYVQVEKKGTESVVTGTSVEAEIDPVVQVEVEMSSKTTKPFNNDIEMMDAYQLCRQASLTLRECINKLGETHAVSGFILTDNDEKNTVLNQYLTVDVKDETTSINYTDGGLLLGSYEDMSALAAKGELPEDMAKLMSHRVELIWPVMVEKTTDVKTDTIKAVETMEADVEAELEVVKDIDAETKTDAVTDTVAE